MLEQASLWGLSDVNDATAVHEDATHVGLLDAQEFFSELVLKFDSILVENRDLGREVFGEVTVREEKSSVEPAVSSQEPFDACACKDHSSDVSSSDWEACSSSSAEEELGDRLQQLYGGVRRPSTSADRSECPSSHTKRGKWTAVEQAFADRLISDFDRGVSRGLKNGQSLRAHLAERLRCDPLRISKRFAGSDRLGKVRRKKRHPSFLVNPSTVFFPFLLFP